MLFLISLNSRISSILLIKTRLISASWDVKIAFSTPIFSIKLEELLMPAVSTNLIGYPETSMKDSIRSLVVPG
jgi:energy-converting hydrogenase Eha subunit A